MNTTPILLALALATLMAATAFGYCLYQARLLREVLSVLGVLSSRLMRAETKAAVSYEDLVSRRRKELGKPSRWPPSPEQLRELQALFDKKN